MNRREFVQTGAYLLIGSWWTLSGFSRAFAGDTRRREQSPRAALIIDDIGRSRRAADRFLDLELPITYAILPHLAFSIRLARDTHARGHEIMLHQPMEPVSRCHDPGPGALRVGASREEIGRIVEENLDSVPYAVGVNNHMGSRFTQSGQGMNAALRVIRRHDLFFIDSLTTGRSVVQRVARRLGVPSARRSVFLDNIRSEKEIAKQLRTLERQAEKWGWAVGIGHPHPETAAAIAAYCCDGLTGGLQWDYVSAFVFSRPQKRPSPSG